MEISNIKLVEAVEKHPELYDHTRVEYSCKDFTEKAWNEIAEEINMPVTECREKWRNLRSSFVKQLNPRRTPLQRKPYYLAEAMKFTLPYLKFHDNPPYNPLDYPRKDDNSKDVVTVPRIVNRKKKADSTLQCQPDRAVPENVPAKVAKITNPRVKKNNSSQESRVEKSDSVKKSSVERSDSAQQSRVEASNSLQQSREEKRDGIQQFLNSLIPDLMQLTDVQLRMYKRKVLLLIDEVSGTDTEICRPRSNMTESRGLQSSFQLRPHDHNQSRQQSHPELLSSERNMSITSQPSPCEYVELWDPPENFFKEES